MLSKVFSIQKRVMWQAAGAAFGALMLVLPAAGAHAQSCSLVVGHYMEHAVAPPACDAPTGLCIAGEYSGVLKGAFEGKATSLAPTADTPATGVVLFTSDSVIHASINGKQGDLIIKNAGAFNTTGDGDIVDLQRIVGGTGELAMASGALRASGTFVNGSGESEYMGSVCLP